MIKDFTYYNPTRIHFGKSALEHLGEELTKYGKTVLLMYGMGSVKKIGLYGSVVESLRLAGKTIVELPGIKPNPTYTQVLEGCRLIRENSVDLILAVGGGSVIDCAKAISVSSYAQGDAWKRYWVDFEPVDNRIVPVGSVLTMAGTGSEMNGGSVITNDQEMLKNGRVFPPDAYPQFSILNPEYTYSVPHYQMASGIFDTLAHLMEQYFSGEDDNTTDYIIEGVMESLIHSSRIALKHSQDYEARSNIMWCATVGLNTLTGLSKDQDWEVHMIEHQVGAYTDCAHGAGLAAIAVPYYRHICRYGLKKFVRFAQKIWHVEMDESDPMRTALAGLDKLADFIQELGLPSTLRELGTTKEMLPLIANSTILGGGYKKLSTDDVLEILTQAF